MHGHNPALLFQRLDQRIRYVRDSAELVSRAGLAERIDVLGRSVNHVQRQQSCTSGQCESLGLGQ